MLLRCRRLLRLFRAVSDTQIHTCAREHTHTHVLRVREHTHTMARELAIAALTAEDAVAQQDTAASVVLRMFRAMSDTNTHFQRISMHAKETHAPACISKESSIARAPVIFCSFFLKKTGGDTKTIFHFGFSLSSLPPTPPPPHPSPHTQTVRKPVPRRQLFIFPKKNGSGH